jgi:5-methylcytosine-specific restriction endonuclease McrA
MGVFEDALFSRLESEADAEAEDWFDDMRRELQREAFGPLYIGPARLRELTAMAYQDYLHTPEWRALRERALEQAEYRCQLCGAKGRLELHHRNYHRNRGRERASDLTVLCRTCHGINTTIRRAVNQDTRLN